MKRILYLDLKSNPGTTDEILRNHGHSLVFTCSYVNALGMLGSQNFDAVVIDNEDENPEVLDFTVQAHCLRPELPVFLTLDWGAELPMALESLAKIGARWPSNAWRPSLIHLRRHGCFTTAVSPSNSQAG